MRKAGSIHIATINMALIDLISKLILSNNIKGIYFLKFLYLNNQNQKVLITYIDLVIHCSILLYNILIVI